MLWLEHELLVEPDDPPPPLPEDPELSPPQPMLPSEAKTTEANDATKMTR